MEEKKNFFDKKTILVIVITSLLFILLYSFTVRHYERKVDIYSQNLLASKTKIETLQLKNGNILHERDSYILKKNELEELLNIKKSELKEIEKKLESTITYISNLKGEVKVDTIITVKDSIVYKNPENATVNFNYNDKWVSLLGTNSLTFEEGLIKKSETNINNLSVQIPLKVGLTESYQIFVTSDNPYVSFSEIEGAVIDKTTLYPPKKKFSWGLQVGFGGMYDIIDKDVSLGPYIGGGLQINF